MLFQLIDMETAHGKNKISYFLGESSMYYHTFKGKVHPRTGTKALRGSRGIALLFL
jgi:hypothetical protein